MRVVVINKGKSLGQLIPDIMTALGNGLDIAAEGAKADFEATVETWIEKPQFTIQKSPMARLVSTTHDLYTFVNDGVAGHQITPVNARVLKFLRGFEPKTFPNVLGSGRGFRGPPQVWAKSVQWPGIAPRNFEEAVGEKWDEKVDEIVQAELNKVQQ